MTIATLPPPSPTPTPIASLTPSPITANSLTPGEPLIAPDAQAQSDRDGQNRREVMRLRGEIRGLERQKAMLQSRRDEYRAQRMEREKESGFSGPPDGAEYSTSLDIDNLDDQIMGKQRDIDTAMMRR